MNICVIGPTYPFRGGVSLYMTLLYRHLQAGHQTHFLGMSRMYPSFLYPGRTDKDESTHYLKVEGVEPILDSLNPWSWWRVFRRVRSLQPDLVIIPWWASFWAPHFWMIASLVKRFTAAKILFICHNVIDHEPTPMSDVFARIVLGTGDYCITHSEVERRKLLALIPSAHVEVAFHPIYDVFATYGRTDKSEARSALDIGGPTALFFGFIRPYKGLKYLIDAIALFPRSAGITLLIVGEFWEDKEIYVRQIRTRGLESSIKIVDRYVKNEEVPIFFSAADAVILPYLSGTGSGIVQLAYGFDVPVIATTVGSFPEVVTHGVTGYLIPPRDPEALAEAIRDVFRNGRAAQMARNVKAEKLTFSWTHLVRAIEGLKV